MPKKKNTKKLDQPESPLCWKLWNEALPHADKILLHGPAGTGKTQQATTQGLSLDGGKPVFSCTLTEDTPAAEIRGHFISKGGEHQWHYGVGMMAWRLGSRLVINEIDHMSGDVASLLYSICDDKEIARLTLPNDETLSPSEGFKVIATMTGDPDELPAPLRDRFPVCIHIDAPHPDAVAMLPRDLRDPALRTIAITEDSRRISIRSWNAFAQLREKMDPESAARLVFGKKHQDVLDALSLAL